MIHIRARTHCIVSLEEFLPAEGSATPNRCHWSKCTGPDDYNETHCQGVSTTTPLYTQWLFHSLAGFILLKRGERSEELQFPVGDASSVTTDTKEFKQLFAVWVNKISRLLPTVIFSLSVCTQGKQEPENKNKNYFFKSSPSSTFLIDLVLLISHILEVNEYIAGKMFCLAFLQPFKFLT